MIEGCDGTGKTTLANQLAEDLNLQFGKRGTEIRDDLYKVTRQDTYRALSHAVEGYHPPFIWDRLGFISDPIYCIHTRGQRGCAFTTDEIMWCIKMTRTIGCPVIVCTVPFETALENARQDKQMVGVLANFEEIYGAYHRLLTVNRNWISSYDYTRGGYDAVKRHVSYYLKRRKEREWH